MKKILLWLGIIAMALAICLPVSALAAKAGIFNGSGIKIVIREGSIETGKIINPGSSINNKSSYAFSIDFRALKEVITADKISVAVRASQKSTMAKAKNLAYIKTLNLPKKTDGSWGDIGTDGKFSSFKNGQVYVDVQICYTSQNKQSCGSSNPISLTMGPIVQKPPVTPKAKKELPMERKTLVGKDILLFNVAAGDDVKKSDPIGALGCANLKNEFKRRYPEAKTYGEISGFTFYLKGIRIFSDVDLNGKFASSIAYVYYKKIANDSNIYFDTWQWKPKANMYVETKKESLVTPPGSVTTSVINQCMPATQSAKKIKLLPPTKPAEKPAAPPQVLVDIFTKDSQLAGLRSSYPDFNFKWKKSKEKCDASKVPAKYCYEVQVSPKNYGGTGTTVKPQNSSPITIAQIGDAAAQLAAQLATLPADMFIKKDQLSALINAKDPSDANKRLYQNLTFKWNQSKSQRPGEKCDPAFFSQKNCNMVVVSQKIKGGQSINVMPTNSRPPTMTEIKAAADKLLVAPAKIN